MMKYFTLFLLILIPNISYSGGVSTNGVAFNGGTSFQIQQEEFISFEDSTTFGASGSIAVLSNRFAIPKEIGLPPDPTNSSLFTQDETSMKNDTCSSDETTINELKEFLDGDGTGDLADNTTLWLPQNCKIKLFMDPTRNQKTEIVIGGNGGGSTPKYDNINLYCADNTTCGFHVVYRPWLVSSPADWNRWDYTAGDTYSNDASEPLQGIAIGIGNGVASALQTCSWTAGYNLGAKMLQTSCTISHSGASAWGPGDIVRLKIADITGYGTLDVPYLTRITCVSNSSGVNSPAVDPGGLCDEITGSNQIQIEDPLPMNYNPTGLYSGAFAGSNYTYCTTCSSPFVTATGTYAVLSGHTIEQIERVGSSRCNIVASGVCGNGTGTNQINEGVSLYKIGWSIYPEYIGGMYVQVKGAFNTHIYRNIMDGRVGGNSAITLAASNGEAGRTSIHTLKLNGGAYNAKCFGEIVAIRQTNPVEIDVQVPETSPCTFEGLGAGTTDTWVGFTSDVSDPDLSGNVFIKRQGSLNTTGTPDIRTFTLEGLDGSCSTGICVDTTPGGLAVDMDSFAMAGIYMKGSSNNQIINSMFPNTTQSQIIQSGSMQTVFAYNYKRATEDFKNGRGPFSHGNTYGSGNLFIMNDTDHAFVPLEDSNRVPTDNGDGNHHLWYKNRCIDSGTTTFPLGSYTDGDYTARGLCFLTVEEDQWGAVNEGWTFALNVADEMFLTTSKIDELSNNPDTIPNVNNAPYFTYDLWWYRNRSGTGSDQDDNFISSPSVNPSTDRDNSATDTDENDSVPSSWNTEIGHEPTSIWPKPSYWDTCTPSAMTFGEMGAYYDDLSNPGSMGKLPAQILQEGGTCTGLP